MTRMWLQRWCQVLAQLLSRSLLPGPQKSDKFRMEGEKSSWLADGFYTFVPIKRKLISLLLHDNRRGEDQLIVDRASTKATNNKRAKKG